MLSDNLETIVGYMSEMAQLEIDNGADANMVYAWGWAAGAVLKEISDLKKQGR